MDILNLDQEFDFDDAIANPSHDPSQLPFFDMDDWQASVRARADDYALEFVSPSPMTSTWEGDGQQEIVLYDMAHTSGTTPDAYVHECSKILEDCFFPQQGLGMRQALERLTMEYGYEVVRILRVQDFRRRQMYETFRQVYGVLNQVQVFHGTSATKAASIARRGVRAAAGVRSRFGRGIYATTKVWEALTYAEPDLDNEMQQEFLVCSMVVGPCKVGVADEVDFGEDVHGHEILNTTNVEQTFYCAKYESQVCVDYRVQTRMSRKPSVVWAEVLRRRHMYHELVKSAILAQAGPCWTSAPPPVRALAAPPPQAVAAQSAQHTPHKGGTAGQILFEFPTYHHGFKTGARVKIVLLKQELKMFAGETGSIKKIARRVNGHGYFFVELDNQALWPEVESMPVSTVPGREKHWLQVKVGALKKL